ncbi:ATP-binding cassette domain-containing protein [Algoriphagus halophilus]|uniref:Molybdate transport system ATP-binding protein n=1 Tax=Algoriphagus halophilus TaxID=226505 RepID=A0A1N6DCD5_9BACT|nr:ATP-binding cassette domain-containing protein [Algoriphagus halophilus]SIN68461.1 molybdate transport system ATP-binding protein [Algoriphagus halophilus]
MSNSILTIHGATVLYKAQQAFENLSFNWKTGENWAVIGDSGWELTTFIETLRGNTVISRGEVHRPFAQAYVQEKTEAGEVHSFRDLIAYVSQKYEFKNRSHIQNFYFQQRFNSSESEETATVREYLLEVTPKVVGPWTLENVAKLLRLEALLDKSILKLSNGETRRLAIALGLMHQPHIYLMDQPMTGLDVRSREEFGTIIQEISKSGVQVLLTTSGNEIPDGITHVAKISKSGLAGRWTKEDYHQSGGKETNIPAWDWDLLQSLLPQDRELLKAPIVLRNVRIKYGDKVILKDVNWEVKAGEKWLLKGKNGSGKSTLISLLIGENPQAYSQNFWLFGRKRGTGESIWDVKRPTGFVAPELSRYFPANQTCRKVILSGLFDTMGLFKKVSPEQEELANQWIRLFNLEPLQHTVIQRLSLEHQRWTLLARALIKQPQLLILDEASQGMDEFQRRLFKETVQRVCEGCSISLIYVSHYEEDVPDAVGKVLELRS